MKRVSVIWIGVGLLMLQLGVIVVYTIYVGSTASDDFAVSEEADLQKYPELTPFICGMVDFRGEVCDIERGSFAFSYLTSATNARHFFESVDKAAKRSGWSVSFADAMARVYETNLQRYSARNIRDAVSVRYDEKTRTVRVTWE